MQNYIEIYQKWLGYGQKIYAHISMYMSPKLCV